MWNVIQLSHFKKLINNQYGNKLYIVISYKKLKNNYMNVSSK
jgi:hypothetical protein